MIIKNLPIPVDRLLLVCAYAVAPLLPYTYPFLIPGALLFRKFLEKSPPISAFTYSITTSISLWIAMYWITSLLPIPLTTLIKAVYLLSLLSIPFISYAPIKHIPFRSLIPLLPLSFITGLLIAPIPQQVAPSGADMATHTYIASHIIKTNHFPQTYEPMLPADSFGLSPIGFPLIAAIISTVGDIPTYQSSLVLSSLVYVFFAYALYCLLRQFFTPLISCLALGITLFLNQDVMQYIGWGGNTTIASIAVLTTTSALAISLYQQKNSLRFFHTITIACMLFGSFAIHQIPTAFSLLALPAIILYLLAAKNPTFLTACIKICFLTLLLTTPFLLRLELPSEVTNAKIMSWQQEASHSWQGTLSNALLTVPAFLTDRIGQEMGLLVLVGLIATLFKSRQQTFIFLSLFAFLFIGIINAKFWFLPLSQLFYPDRLVTLFTALFGLCIATLLTTLHHQLNKFIKSKQLSQVLILILMLITPLPPNFQNSLQIMKTNLDWYLSTSQSQVMVTQNDLKALNWLAKNTTSQDIIQNNYGDAGLWIPAIAYRKTIIFDATPFEYDDLDKWLASQPTPTYAYIGDNAVYGSEITQTPEDYENNPDYQLVYRSGEARVYKRLTIDQ